jgi:hypothetical protein
MKNKEVIKSDINFLEACNLLNKSKRTVSRYIKLGRLKPERIKSRKGTIEYRFKKADLDNFIIPGRQDTIPDKRQAKGQDSDVITLLKDTTQVLRDQLKVKDEQIKGLGKKIDQLIERSRESNILMGGLQNRLLMLEQGNKDEKRVDKKEATQDTNKTGQGRGQKIKGFFNRLFKGNKI